MLISIINFKLKLGRLSLIWGILAYTDDVDLNEKLTEWEQF